MTTSQGPIEGMLEWYRKDPAAADEAEKNWQSGRDWREARAERGNAHRLFRLIESKAKLQRP